MPQLRSRTLVAAPLTVTFDAARSLELSWPRPLIEVASDRPWCSVHQSHLGLLADITHTRRFVPTAAGTLVDEQVDWHGRIAGLPGWLLDGMVLRRHLLVMLRRRNQQIAAVARRRAHDVVTVVGAALVRGDRVLVAQRGSGALAGLWEFPGGKVEPGENELAGLVRECQEELDVRVEPEGFLGEVPLDGAVRGGAPGASSLRVWWGRVAAGEPVATEHTEVRWVRAAELEGLDWIPADRPLLPALRELLAHR